MTDWSLGFAEYRADPLTYTLVNTYAGRVLNGSDVSQKNSKKLIMEMALFLLNKLEVDQYNYEVILSTLELINIQSDPAYYPVRIPQEFIAILENQDELPNLVEIFRRDTNNSMLFTKMFGFGFWNCIANAVRQNRIRVRIEDSSDWGTEMFSKLEHIHGGKFPKQETQPIERIIERSNTDDINLEKLDADPVIVELLKTTRI